jgi:hypothetical protein
MSDRPSAVNGKRSRTWGTLGSCPACGRCLCFGCHPAGPCLDDAASGDPSGDRRIRSGFSAASSGAFEDVWVAGSTIGSSSVAGLGLRAAFPDGDRLR